MSLELPQSLSWAHPVTAEWFLSKFGSPTEPQTYGWPGILDGNATLISAPTGSGKTLAAFLVCIDQLLRQSISGRLAPCTQVLYVSPLKALSNDVQKNLAAPLSEIQQLAMQRGYLCPEIRTGVRTGDTLPKERAAMLRNPPHILVTTPESLYILLTAGKSREHLRRVQTVIVDEIHAVADDKRGAHLALSLERLDALVTGENHLSHGQFLTGLAMAPQRIGLSATQNPIELVASFLTGSHEDRKPATIVQVGRRRELDIAIEVPSDELSSVTNSGMWEEIFEKLAAYAQNHRSTLVFVNTRRLVEKIAFELASRLGPEHVAAHHGSLSRTLRLDAEQRLKNGEIKILIATASLELGIDIGDIDLVCQISTTRSVAVAMQRVGRAGHWRGATPKGRFFATTRDDLLEQAALTRKMRAGELDQLQIPPQPADVLMQQIVAACGAEPWEEDALYNVLRRAYPYRNLTRPAFDDLLTLLTAGIESTRGRYGAYLLRDGVQQHLHPRRGARMIAISNGGAIPDTALYSVILQPEGVQIATLDEHFAVDSSPGDVILLGTSSWRIQRVEASGRVLVEDAHGAPPSLPFWEGEAPQRTAVLSDGVSELREQISALTFGVDPGYLSPLQPEVAAATAWLMQECGVCASGARQLIAYIVAGRAALGAVPSKTTIIAERFFDDGGGMQLILHAPFGGRINKAWGLALRKRFCRGFNFELQAAATDNGINISLAEQHSFPLADVFQFLTEYTARELLEQASIASPIFKNRWRWAAGRSLQLLRFYKGKRIAPQIQRTRSEDLMASVFPQAAACFETIVGDIQIPNHPLVNEVMQDVLQEAMDLEGLIELLRGIKEGAIRCLAVDTPTPSQFAHELLNANPYAYLDEAGLEERRARATSLGRNLPDQPGKLDPAAIADIHKEIWPDLRNEHELHDLLHSLIVLPLHLIGTSETKGWQVFYDRLAGVGRVHAIDCRGSLGWVATERLSYVDALWQTASNQTGSVTKEEALKKLVQGWLQISGPITANALAHIVSLQPAEIFSAFLAMEMQGLLIRGAFEHPALSTGSDLNHDIEWCERRILQRIHRRTVATLRKQVEAVTPAVYMRWFLNWQHLAPQTQLSGEEGVFEALRQLEGFEAPAVEWERTLLPSRVAKYDPRWLDALCLSGAVGWGRISPHPAWSAGDGAFPRRVIPTSAAPVTFYIRETADWLPYALALQCVEEGKLAAALSPAALQLRTLLQQRGACFANDIQRIANLTRQQSQQALWELATAGLAAADGFDQLRACMDPRRRSITTETATRRTARSSAGRWSLLNAELHAAPTAVEQAHRTEAALESFARQLLNRYGILFRDLLVCESNAPRWRDLLPMLRRLEARGEIRGGRFLSGFGGEQYALPEAVESLRASRTRESSAIISVAAADPANLVGVVIPGDRVPSVPGKRISYCDGKLYAETHDQELVDLSTAAPPYPASGHLIPLTL
ncbi:DEAD/DEAH box helicase [Tunturiibacter empetritectus]|uniref:ATP-dependent Lhr-like helicase n=1 Tax=Tunturiibacter lichenicola TaxID=2051959 RepID=A0A852VAG2_9BACT|nr:DEAD/DEAH box helicase [Edaphobacter lichenicola]NYF88417.1 ATP-dependent Lhr-like helicase [Edaphobacter lichenicola]